MGYFVKHAALFDSLAGIAVMGLAAFGVLIAIAIFPVMLGVPAYGTEGTMTEPYEYCKDEYLETIGTITEEGTSMRPPRGYWRNSTVEGWAATHCTDAQYFFTICVKGFTFIFSYINFLPIPWRLSIWNEAFFGRPMMDDELKLGCDFYGRPTEALWFHLPRPSRKRITVLLNLAWATHFISQISHLVYWTHSAGQEVRGMLAQNIPFVTSIVSGVAAGVIQGSAEKKVMAEHPGRFPPKYDVWVKAALKDAVGRYRDETAHQGGRLGCCFCCSRAFLRLLHAEAREEKAKFDEEQSRRGAVGQGKGHGLTGINLAGSTKAFVIKDADGAFDEAVGAGAGAGAAAGAAAHMTLQQLTEYLRKHGNLPKKGAEAIYEAANTSRDANGIGRADWKEAIAAGSIPGHSRASSTASAANDKWSVENYPAAAPATSRAAALAPGRSRVAPAPSA